MIRIFVGCSANGEDAEAQALLEYTLRHYASEPVELNWMKLSRDPGSPWYSNPGKREGWRTARWATPFSLFRWAIPHVCNFEGKAIYMDVDMIFRADVKYLWEQTIPDGKCLLTKSEAQSCVMLMDNARCKAVIPAFDILRMTESGHNILRKNVFAHAAKFEGNWNCLDGENYKTLADPDIKIIHFTKVETQPHLKWALPRLRAKGQAHWNRMAAGLPHARADVQPLVDRLWKEAQAAGYSAEKYIPAAAGMYGRYDAVRGGERAA